VPAEPLVDDEPDDDELGDDELLDVDEELDDDELCVAQPASSAAIQAAAAIACRCAP
jgi:hypothetical protein